MIANDLQILLRLGGGGGVVHASQLRGTGQDRVDQVRLVVVGDLLENTSIEYVRESGRTASVL